MRLLLLGEKRIELRDGCLPNTPDRQLAYREQFDSVIDPTGPLKRDYGQCAGPSGESSLRPSRSA